MIKRIVLLGIATVLVGLTSTSDAQATVDPALLAVVTQAFDQTLASPSLHIETQSLVGQQQSSSSWDMVAAETGWNLSGSQTTQVQRGENQIETTIQYVVVDGVTYLNLGDFQGVGPGGQELPEGWFALSADGIDQGFPIGGRVGNLSGQALGGLMLPISTDAVTSIVELPSDTLNGQTMQIYQISLDPQAVIDSDAQSLLSFGRGGMGGFAGGGVPPAAPADGQSAPPDNVQPPAFDQALDPSALQVTFAVYIGQGDGLIHRIYSVIETTLSRDDGTQMVTKATTISDFSTPSEPIQITAPEVSA